MLRTAFLLCLLMGAASANEEIECLALNIYHEARSEPELGQYAVAAVTMNRVHDPHYPATVCAVVWQKRQFSWTSDGKSDKPKNLRAWRRAMAIAKQAYSAAPTNPVGNAKHYHANYVNPDWAQHMTLVATIGRHVFYR